MKELDAYNASRLAMNEYFGYQERWEVLPYEDAREMYWRIDGDTVISHVVRDSCKFASDACEFANPDVSDWIYRGHDFTMLRVDPQQDGNEVLKVFDNAKEVKP